MSSSVDKITRDIKARQGANNSILEIMKAVNQSHPDLRFHQILSMLDIIVPEVDQFYEESTLTLKRVNEAVNRLIKGDE